MAGLLGVGLSGTASADGMPRPGAQGAAAGPVTGRATFVCRGGVRVQVTLMTGAARVAFAGQTRTLSLVEGSTYRNSQVTWFTQDAGTAAMKNNLTGRLQLSGCRSV
ncbi:hypothetical protein CVO96_04470 [Deinococcus koreensis]|uniref:C-type lysozyme inhibitor domain-containing protein n=1 Tax=Deinococcus koreensis TaxID=2054903 RepID=A0A2K3UVZ7_9DEIO|nr:hypothetical protein CVO96_04470 [Deinococcus koreensis]